MLVPRYSVVFACKVKGPKFWGSVCKMCVWPRVLRMTVETLAGMQSSDLPTQTYKQGGNVLAYEDSIPQVTVPRPFGPTSTSPAWCLWVALFPDLPPPADNMMNDCCSWTPRGSTRRHVVARSHSFIVCWTYNESVDYLQNVCLECIIMVLQSINIWAH